MTSLRALHGIGRKPTRPSSNPSKPFLQTRQFFIRLEDLVVSPRLARELLEFLELSYRDDHFRIFGRPHNLNRPGDRPLSDEQRETFASIASAMMERLGYAERDEYVVNY
jgi:hypothetical protein